MNFKFKQNFLYWLCCVLFCGYPNLGLHAQSKKGVDLITSLVQAEKNFAKDVANKGQRQGFLDVITPNAILFRPGPVNAQDFFQKKSIFHGSLLWTPTWAEISKDGYFGYTTGPYSFLINDTTYYGEYVSIWRRDPYQKKWQLFLDAGISHGKPHKPEESLAFPEHSVPTYPNIFPKVIAASKDILFATDELFATILNTRPTEKAYSDYLNPDSRLFLEGLYPIKGSDSILHYLSLSKGIYACHTTGAYVCYSRDMGFTYGKGEFIDAYRKKPKDHKFNYLRIWQKNNDGLWHIILEMHMPA